MHRFSQYRPADPGMPIRGTFYPSQELPGVASMASVLPKVLLVLAGVAILRAIVGARHHGGGPRWGRRREAIAAFHRELHAQDEATKA
jgi:hypothetical protein